MILKFKTKNNTCGWAHYLYIDTKRNLYTIEGSSWESPDCIVLTYQQLKKLKSQIIENNFSEIFTFQEWREKTK